MDGSFSTRRLPGSPTRWGARVPAVLPPSLWVTDVEERDKHQSEA
jgi:hypothetical protein